MPKFVTIGYGDQAGYDRTPQAIRDAAHAHDTGLQRASLAAQGRAILNAQAASLPLSIEA